MVRAQDQGVDISPTAAKLLAELVGNKLWVLAGELDKLAAYAQGRRIEGADVKALVSAAREVNVFAMVDAVVERRAPAALRLLRQQVAEGAQGGYLLAMVVRQYRLIIQAKELSQSGITTPEIGQRLGIGSNFVLQRVLDQADRYTLSRLKAAYRRLLEADESVKRGRYNEELALELLVHDRARI
jgi:DNA polymerase-3 subunit delta